MGLCWGPMGDPEWEGDVSLEDAQDWAVAPRCWIQTCKRIKKKDKRNRINKLGHVVLKWTALTRKPAPSWSDPTSTHSSWSPHGFYFLSFKKNYFIFTVWIFVCSVHLWNKTNFLYRLGCNSYPFLWVGPECERTGNKELSCVLPRPGIFSRRAPRLDL